MTGLLLPFSWLYGFGILCRNMAFDLGLLKSTSVGVPVISVGNMTMGGTGKTPLVEYIVGVCLAKGRRVAVVSRGYKRGSSGVLVVSDGERVLANVDKGGDEPVQIARKYPKAIVVVGERRVEAARKAVGEMNANVIVLDDGFQHRYLRRDLDIVVVDARKNLYRTRMIPAGERREPMGSIKRAQLVAFSRADAVKEGGGWERWLSNQYRGPKINYQYKLDRIVQIGSDMGFVARDLKGKKMMLFSGIGDHQDFVRQMGSAGMEVVGNARFPDHHAYTEADLKWMLSRVVQTGADGLLTTEKDYIRLSGNASLLNRLTGGSQLYYARIVVEIVNGQGILDALIERCLSGKAA
ncbi:MAG TPA: tetraacyldisaccharide 4'-kinase [Bacteroidetes bacterium]|nr:tetraacyldisaccharide 4'-kinase [Bacteroidota bacterium]